MEHLWPVLLKLLVVAFLVAANGFFVAVEFALVSLRRAKIEALIAQGHAPARLVKRLLDQTDRILAAAQLGITMASLALGWLGEETVAELLYPIFAAVLPALGAGIATHAAATGIAFILITALHIVLGEQAPKIYSIRHPERIAFLGARPILWFEWLFRPFIWVLDRASQLTLQLVGIERAMTEPGRLHSLEDLKQQFSEVHRRGLLGRREEEMLHHVLEFPEQDADEVMIPRPDVVSIEESASLEELIELFREFNHTRYPVYRERPENVIGYVSIKDALRAIGEDPKAFTRRVRTLMHPIRYVPENKSVSTLFAEMQRERLPMVAVVNEHGDTVGIVTLKDLAEEIVGRLEDEPKPKETPLVERLDERTLRVDGGLRVEEANEELGLSLPEGEDYQTIAGLILSRLQRVPTEGETLRVNGVQLEVERMKGPRIEKVLIRL
jgi:CBS domain containing-hemolysin-like protein